MEDIIDISKTIQSELSNFASGPMSEVTDLTKQVRDNFIEANSAANLEITGEDKLAKMGGQLSGIQKGYEKSERTLRELQLNLNGITDTTDLWTEASLQQENIQKRIENAKAEEEKITNNIADSQQKLLMLEQARETVTFNSDEYKEYTELINDANANILQQQSNIFGLQAQSKALKGIHDGYLGTIIKEAEAQKSINEITATRRQLFLKNAKISELNLDLIKQQKSEIERLGPGLKSYIEKWGFLNDNVMKSFDSIAEGMVSTAQKIPFVGNMIANNIKGPLTEAAKESKEKWQSFTEAMQSDMSGASGEALSFTQAFKKNFGMLGGAIGGMGKAITSALFNPFTLVLAVVGGILFLLKSAYDELSRLESSSMEFRKELGLSASESSRLREEAESLENTYSHLGLRVDDFYQANTALLEVFSSAGHVTKEQTTTIALMEKAYGVQASTTAGAMNNLMKLGATGRGQAESMVMNMKALAGKHGVQFAKVMEDVAAAGEDALLFTRGSAKALAEGAVHARRLGSTMDDVASSAMSLLDFESSISAEMEASTMFGRHINMNGLRAAAMAGDTNAMLNERMRIMDDLGGLDNMNMWQQQRLAEAMGTNVETLQNMIKTREQENMLIAAKNRGEAWAVKEMALRAKESKKTTQDAEKQLQIEIQKNREMEQVNALTDTLSGHWLKVKKALLPIVNELMKKLIGFIDDFGIGTDDSGSSIDKMKDGMNSFLEPLMSAIKGIWNVVSAIGEAVSWVLKLFTITDNWVVNLGIAAGILVGIKVTFGLISGLAGSIVSKLLKGGGGGGAGGGRGGILGSIANFINRIKPQNILAAAAALAIIAGALFVSAKAFQEFGKVNWDNAWPGILVLGGLVGAAFLLGKAGPSIIAGAVAVGILSLSLIPLAFALNMMKDVGLESVLVIAGSLLVLGFAAVKLGAIMMSGVGAVAILAGAFAIAALGASLIPLAYALKTATPGIEAFGTMVKEVFSGMVDMVEAVGGVLVSVITAIGGAVEGIIGAISTAMSTMIQDIVSLSEVNPLQLIAIAAAIGTLGLALASFGVGGGVGSAVSGAGNAVGAMGNAIAGVFGADTKELNKSPLQKILDFAAKSEDIALVADKVDSLLGSFDRLSDMEDILERAASSIRVFSDALASFGMGNASVGIGNAVGAIGNKIAGFFGADAPQDPIDQLLGFIEKLSSVSIDTESLEVLSRLDMNGFLGNITDDFEDKIEIASEGLSELFESFGKINPTSVMAIEKASTGVGRLLAGISNYIPKIKTSDSKNLAKVADGLGDFFEAVNDLNLSKVQEIPHVGTAISSLSVGLENANIIPTEVNSILSNLGEGIEEFFSEIGDVDLKVLSRLPVIQEAMLPFISKFATIPYDKFENAGTAFKNLGWGIEQFSDYLNDGEGDAIREFFKDAGSSFIKFTDSIGKLSGIGDIDLIGKLTSLTDVTASIDIQSTENLKQFTSGVVDAMNAFSGIQDPAIEALSAITDELYALCNAINTLDIDKLSGLENINLGGVQTEIKIPSRKLPVGDPFTEGDVIQGTLPPQFSMKDTNSPLHEVFTVGSTSSAIEETMTKRAKEREATFRRQYETVEQLTSRIEHDMKALADEKTRAIATNNLKNYEYGEKLMLEDIAVLEKIRAEFMAEQSAVDATTPSTEEFENTPLASVFTSPPPIEPTIEAQETAIETVVAPTPSVEAITESQDTDLANFFTGPIDVKVINADEISKSKMDESAYDKFKTELIESMGDRSLEGYESEIKSYIETNKELIKMGAENSRTGLDLNKFSMENKFMDKLLQEIEQEKSFEAENAKMIKESQIQGELMSLQDLKNNLSSPDGMHLQSNDYAKISSTLGINATGMERDLFINDKTGKVDHQFFKNEVLKMIHERESELINYDIVDSTSTIPTVPKLEIPSDQTKQPEFILDTVPEAPPISGVDNMVQAISGTTRSVVDFGKNLLSDFFGKEPEIEDSTTNIELSGLDNISVKGHNIFVEEIAKIVNKDTPTSDSEKTEDNTKVVKKLDELILLMRNGGISVNMDGRKVSRAIASSHD